MRTLFLLDRSRPESLDLARLVLLDYALLHSRDLGGPESLHPALPIRGGEVALKRSLIERGLRVLVRGGLVAVEAGPAGLGYRATDEGHGFLELLTSPYSERLREFADWTVRALADLSDEEIRSRMSDVIDRWSVEFDGASREVSE
jgi:hypothetical protein